MAREITKVIDQVLKDAANKRSYAGFNGEMGDGGASSLESQVKFYRYGQSGVLPEEWNDFAKQADRESDPEYAKFLELKGKFE